MDISINLQQELKDHQYFLEIERKKFLMNKIFLDTLRELTDVDTDDSVLSAQLKSKLFGSLLKHSLPTDEVIELGNADLNYDELKTLILKQLIGKYNKICNEFSQIVGVNIKTAEDYGGFNVDGSLEVYKSLKIQYDLFVNNLEKLKAILNEMTQLQSEKLSNVCREKIEQHKVQTKLQLSRAQTVANKLKIDIFTEHNYTLNAYRKLCEDMKKENIKLKQNIEDLKVLKQKYRQISCKQFDELLRTFKQYKLAIEKKKLLLEHMT